MQILRACVEDGMDLGEMKLTDEIEMQGKKIPIGSWISYLRREYTKNTLSDKVVVELESLGMRWESRKVEQSYTIEKKMEILRACVENGMDLGKVKIKESINIEGEEIPIGSWISSLRREYTNNKLKDEVVAELESFGMRWESEVAEKKYTIEEKIQKLKKYVESGMNLKEVKLNDSIEIEGEKIPIGNWISSIRKEYTDGTLTSEAVATLENFGMRWKSEIAEKGYTIEQKIEILRACVEDGMDLGKIKLTDRIEMQGKEIPIGNWINILRSEYMRGNLNDEIVKNLENLGMKWKSKLADKSYTKEEKIKMLGVCVKSGINLGEVKTKDSINIEGKQIPIGSWINSLRRGYTNNALSDKEVKELEGLGMHWSKLSNLARTKKQLCQKEEQASILQGRCKAELEKQRLLHKSKGDDIKW